MTIFTKEMMWQAAVQQMGTENVPDWTNAPAIVLRTPEEVEELYKALQLAHASCVEHYEREIW